jgi:AraC-like DNA-binding protein
MRAAGTPQARLALLEAELLARLARSRHGMHPAIARVLEVLPSLPSVNAAVRLSGLSHRQFIVHFRQAVGLAPKAWLRVQRFQHALRRLHAAAEPLAAVAAEAGYADQAHFSREFQALAGVTPRAYRAIAPREANHLPVPHAAC